MLGGELSPAEGVQLDGKLGTDSDEAPAPVIDFRRCISFIGATYFLVMTAYIVPVACVASCVLLLPLLLFKLSLFNRLEQKLCRFVNDHWITTAFYGGLQVREYGDDLSKYATEKCLYLANHLGLVDHFVVMTSLHNKGPVPGSWMWVIYNIWKYTPLGAMWTMHGNFFVNGGASKRAALLATFREHLRKYFARHEYSWVIMYPEGSRLYLIRESGAAFAKKNGLEPLQHCVYPRSGAAYTVLDVLGPKKGDTTNAQQSEGRPVKYIIDATLGYPKGEVVALGGAMMGDFPLNDSSIAIHYEVIPVDPEWADEEKLQKFLYDRYHHKNAILDEFYRTGHFPGQRRGTVQVSNQAMLLSQVFWIGTYYIHHLLWIRPLWQLLVAFASSLVFF